MSPPRSRFAGRRPSETTFALLGAYFLLVTLYAWQAWRRETPTIFTDELELTQISRAISEVGHPARRGADYGFTTLAPWLTAPFWWISSIATAYEVIKYVQALVMALAIFPAFAIARTVVSRPWALFAAIGTIAAPALSYAPILVEEPWAYPIAVTALWLIIRAVEKPSRGAVALAVGACVVGMMARSQLAALGTTLAIALGLVAWTSPRIRAWRATWTRWDKTGAIVIGIGLLFGFSALMGHLSHEWQVITGFWKGRIFEYGAWASGAFAIGVGIIPVIAMLAVLALPRSERDRPGMRTFIRVTGAATLSFWWYAALKGAYLSTIFSSLIVERNLVYLTPLALTATAIVLARAAVPAWAILASAGLVIVAIVAIPLDRAVDFFPYYEAHGLSILAFFNREFSWPLGRLEVGVVVLALLGAVVLIAAGGRWLGSHTTRRLAILTAGFVLAWNLTNEIYASVGEHDFSSRVANNLAQPHNWVDRAVGSDGVTILAQHVADGDEIWGNEFWNRSIEQVWSVDGSAPGPGPTLSPNLTNADGTLWPSPGTRYILAVNGVEVAGEEVGRAGTDGPVLMKIGNTLKLRANWVGLEGDGWMRAKAAYNRFDVSEDGDDPVVVRLSRETFCPKGVKLPGTVTVRIGPLAVGADKQPALAKTTASETVYVPGCGTREIAFNAPDGPWRIELESETFVPSEVDPENTSDSRDLGAVVGVAVSQR